MSTSTTDTDTETDTDTDTDVESDMLDACPRCGADPKRREGENWKIIQYCTCGNWGRAMGYKHETPFPPYHG